jgi:hypothetical protein
MASWFGFWESNKTNQEITGPENHRDYQPRDQQPRDYYPRDRPQPDERD